MKSHTNLFPKEEVLVPFVIKMLKDNDAPLKSEEIIKEIHKKKKVKLDKPRIRRIINHIRTQTAVKNVLASNRGYYISSDKTEVKRYLKNLDDRIRSLQIIKRTLK